MSVTDVSGDSGPCLPGWAEELSARIVASPQLVLAGAVDDLQPVLDAGAARLLSTEEVVGHALARAGVPLVLGWRPVEGIRAVHDRTTRTPYWPNSAAADPAGLAAPLLGQHWRAPEAGRATATDLQAILTRVVEFPHPAEAELDISRVALIVTDASRLAPSLTERDMHDLYVTAGELRRRAGRRRADGPRRRTMYNPVIWLTGNQADLPHWLIGAPDMQVISVPRPLLADRLIAARSILPQLPGAVDLDRSDRDELVRRLAFTADGLSLTEMRAAMMLARDRDIPAPDLEQALSLQRYGLRNSPWQDPGIRGRIAGAESALRAAVIGQERAVCQAADILARSALGLSGAHSGSHPGRPQGVLFLAGPTGVGKTELAKQIATLVFGRPDALVRFDMSEFAAEHSQARLLGSPPGYVGHEAGGELTNAVRDKPFSLLLFDEIEKAHPRILDKFLQILEDGRLTDGAGSTVDFGETMIIFTSNLGTLEKQADGSTRPIPYETPIDKFEATVLENVRRTFIEGIERPELLNRIGEKNVLVLHYLSVDAAQAVADRDLATVVATIRRTVGVTVDIDDDAKQVVHYKVTRPAVLYNGGRGVGAEIEQLVVNPLARELIARPETGAVAVTAAAEPTGATDRPLLFRATPRLTKAGSR